MVMSREEKRKEKKRREKAHTVEETRE